MCRFPEIMLNEIYILMYLAPVQYKAYSGNKEDTSENVKNSISDAVSENNLNMLPAILVAE